MKNIFLSIVNFNGQKNTLECLNSIKKLTRDNFQIRVAVIDNGSEEKLDIQNNYLGNIPLTVIRNSKNAGFTGGNNIGIKYACSKDADYILVLNNDTLLDKNLIIELIKTSELNKNTGIVSPKIYFAKGFEFHKDRYAEKEKGKVIWYAGGVMDWKNVMGHHRGVDEVDNGQYNKTEETDFASGACFLVKREVIKKIGMFDQQYFLYYEDSDFSQRTKKAGYKILYEPKAVLWHKNAGSAGLGSALQDYYITRNRLLFGMKHAPFRSKIALIKESFRILAHGRRWQRQGVLDFYLRNFGKGSFGLI